MGIKEYPHATLTRLAAERCLQQVFGKRRVEVVANVQTMPNKTHFAGRCEIFERSKASYRPAGLRDQDRLPCCHPFEEAGEVGFGFVSVDDLHVIKNKLSS